MTTAILPPPGAPQARRPAPGDRAARATPADAFWSVPVDRLLETLGAQPRGLGEAEARNRLARYGPNVGGVPPRAGPLRLLGAQFASPITALLAVAALLSIGVGEAIDGTIILAILLLSGLLGYWQERRAADVVARLLALVRTTSTVVRDGVAREVAVEMVVPGDVVRLRAGSSVPADARLLAATDLYVDEAALTGESYPAEKAAGVVPSDAPLSVRRNAVYFGTHVLSGMATAVVVHTGASTAFGAIASGLAARPAATEFEHGVRRFGYLLLELASVMALAIFAVNVALHRPVIDALLFTLALTVGLTPQLLPAIVSVTLAQGARHLARERVIVRRLESIENLGAMTILCTDKTGTLTEGVAAVHSAEDWCGTASAAVRRYAEVNAALATGYANPIDAMLRTAPTTDVSAWRKTDEVPYDFTRKRVSVAATHQGRHLLLTKGALGSVLEVCDVVGSEDGTQRPLDADVRAAIQGRYEALSRDGRRCIGVAYRELPAGATVGHGDERGLVFVGLLSFADPLKPGAPAALATMAALGIGVKVVTGDNQYVARRLATDVGLAPDRILTGSQLTRLSADALATAAQRTDVFAEIEPDQKERIILALKRAGHTVGFLGDGINDAAALHAADVGISVDTAADVTKAAADLVLLDKDLAVLARGVREGRRAFANTLKYVFITTSANFGNMLSMAIASLVATFLPMLPKQILLLNVLTDLPAVAIASDRADPELTARPRRWDTAEIRRFMLAFGVVSSAFDLLTFGTLLVLHVSTPVFRTAWFVESVLSEILVLLVIRTRRPCFRSPIGRGLAWASVTIAIATVLLPCTPLARALGFAPLPLPLAVVIAAIVGGYVAASEAAKRWFYRARRGGSTVTASAVMAPARTSV